ncbi:LolA family protein [Lysobacter fragariae]
MSRSWSSPSLLALALVAPLALLGCKRQTDTAAAAPAAAAPAANAQLAPANDAATPAPASGMASASALDTIKGSMAKFVAVRSYHATMRLDGGARSAMNNEVDFVAPDRYRMNMEGMGTQVVIGDTMYMSMRGRTMQVPMQPGSLTQWRDPARMQEVQAGMTVESLGSETLDGTATRKYVVHHTQPKPTDVTMWIDGHDLPMQIVVHGSERGNPFTVTTRYSRFNDPSIAVDPPQ